MFLKEMLALDKRKKSTEIQKVFKIGAFELKLADNQTSAKYFKEPNVFDDNLMSQEELE